MRPPGGDARPPDAALPPPILPTLCHEPAAGERRSLLGDGLGPSSSALAAFDGVERGRGGGGRGDGPPSTSTSAPWPALEAVSATAVSPPIARKLDRALLPALCTLTLVNYLDRCEGGGEVEGGGERDRERGGRPFVPSIFLISPVFPLFPITKQKNRSNLAFAALPMRADTGITEAQYG